MSEKKEKIEQDTYQSVSDELASILNFAPQEMKETWSSQVEGKNKEDDELRKIEELEKEYPHPYALYEMVKEINVESEGGRKKEEEIEKRFISEYFRQKKEIATYPNAFGSWIFSIVVAVLVTLFALIIGFSLSFIGIIIAIVVVLFFWGRVIEKKEAIETINNIKEKIRELEEKYIVTNDSVKLKK